MSTKIIMRKTVYPGKTIIEWAYNSLELAEYDHKRIGTNYDRATVKPIKYRWGKYWVIVEITSWWAGKHPLDEKRPL
jgi:hypothetical protein